MRRGLLLGLLGILAMGAGGCVNIDSGYRGVKWTAVGGTQDEVYAEGLKFIFPWDRMYRYSIRIQDHKEDLTILSRNGLQIGMEVSIRFRLDAEKLFKIHTTLGPRYYSDIIAPQFRSEGRKVAGRYLPEEIYSSKRETLENEMLEALATQLREKDVIVEKILIRDVTLPPKLLTAITGKLEEEQRSLKMEYTLSHESQEADRKRIEAQGIADFQRIVSKGINQQLLQWKGIEATEALAKSNNTKIVVIGSGSDGLPIILGQ